MIIVALYAFQLRSVVVLLYNLALAFLTNFHLLFFSLFFPLIQMSTMKSFAIRGSEAKHC